MVSNYTPNNMKSSLEYRMYGFVPYNLSNIQKGIQFGHGVVEYQLKYGKSEEYKKWSKEDKTFIILNGGTTNSNPNKFGSLNLLMEDLLNLKIPFSCFYEPDLGDQLTAVVFLVDERVWNNKKYPDSEGAPFEVHWADSLDDEEVERISDIRNFLSQFKLA